MRGAAPCAESVAQGHEEYEKDDVGRLREEADILRQQLDETMNRLDQRGQ
ncbi:MAG: hypothetical protein ABIK79_00915 [Chloroflexota bacterium]